MKEFEDLVYWRELKRVSLVGDEKKGRHKTWVTIIKEQADQRAPGKSKAEAPSEACKLKALYPKVENSVLIQ